MALTPTANATRLRHLVQPPVGPTPHIVGVRPLASLAGMPDVPRPIIFDLDGTVWDSAPGIVSCMEATLHELGLPDPGRAALQGLLGPPIMAMLAGIGVPEDRLDDARVIYRRHYRDHGEFECEVYPGVPDLLDRLRASGHALATGTSKGVEVAERMLDHFDLRRRFDVVAAASMTQAGHSKIDVIGEALAGLEAAGAPATTAVMVGDRNFDVEGGRHFGLLTIGVSWGYAPDDELTDAGADHVVTTIDDLAGLLLGHTK